MTTRSELMENLEEYRFNSSAIQRAIITEVRKTFTGELDALHPMSPFVFLMEAASTLAATSMQRAGILTQRQYPSMAQTYDDLYLHMSDKDYVGRFGRPAPTEMKILIGKEEAINKAVAVPGSDIRMLQIPRHSVFTVGGAQFTMQYPIDIRVMPHGGLQVVYDNSKPSPLYTLESNRVTTAIRTYDSDRVEWLELTVPVHQFSIKSRVETVSPSQIFSKSYEFADSFYSCRIYRRVGSDWVEIPTTYTGRTYDPMQPTAVIKVTDKTVQISFPAVYQNSGILVGDIRMDVYTTKGEIEMPLSGYATDQFKFTWLDHEGDDTRYSAPLSMIHQLAVYSDRTVLGGTTAMTFERLRDRVMTNSLGSVNIPITDAQMTARLEDINYDLTKHVDQITKRQFIASKPMPIVGESSLTSGVGSMTGRIAFTFDGISDRSFVADNGNRITIKPDALYSHSNGIVSLIAEDELELIKAMPTDQLVEYINGGDYLYTPFHYVLDINDNSFVTRPYHLGDGEIHGKQFIDENGTLGLQVSGAQHIVSQTADGKGWRVRVATTSSEEFKALPDSEVFVQLAIRPQGESRAAFVNGTLIGRTQVDNERIYEFIVTTNWDVNSEDEITLTSFAMFDTSTAPFRLGLDAEYDILYAVKDPQVPGQLPCAIDDDLGHHLLPGDVVGLYHERLSIKLGSSLDRLWTRARSTVTDLDYLRHAEDVYAVYEHNVYERDAVGPVVTIVNGKPEFTLLHSAGDRVKDSDGNDIVLYPKGSTVLDSSNNPVIIGQRGVRREMDVVLFDGVFYFANTTVDVRTKNAIATTVIEALEIDLAPVERQLLEETVIFFRPRTTMGMVNVTVGEMFRTRILAEQEVYVTLYVRRSVYRDDELKAALSNTTAVTVASMFDRDVVATSDIISTLKAALGDDVISIEFGISSPAYIGNSSAITLNDPGTRLSIGKRLVPIPDGTIAAQDTINVSYILHVEG